MMLNDDYPNITDLTCKISKSISEDMDNFIIDTIYDYCGTVCDKLGTEKISKHELAYAIAKYYGKERPTGHWAWDENGIDHGVGCWVCSVCLHKPESNWEHFKKTNPLRWNGSKFCPNCGAKMDEVTHELS